MAGVMLVRASAKGEGAEMESFKGLNFGVLLTIPCSVALYLTGILIGATREPLDRTRIPQPEPVCQKRMWR